MSITSKVKIILSFLIFFVSNVNGQGFRNYPWGTSKSKIIQEDGAGTSDKYGISYKKLPIDGIYADHTTFFYFDDAGLLRSGGYSFKFKTEEERNLVFKKMVSLYGEPKKGVLNVFWPYEMGFSDPRYVWQTNDSVILLSDEGLPAHSSTFIVQYYEGIFFQKLYKKSKAGL